MRSILEYEVRELFDPVQTHAAYKVPVDAVPEVKSVLKEIGANRFRIVKTGIKGLVIVCFKLKSK